MTTEQSPRQSAEAAVPAAVPFVGWFAPRPRPRNLAPLRHGRARALAEIAQGGAR